MIQADLFKADRRWLYILAAIVALLLLWLALSIQRSGNIEAVGDIKSASEQAARDAKNIVEEAKRQEEAIRVRQKRETKILPSDAVAVGLDALLRGYRESR